MKIVCEYRFICIFVHSGTEDRVTPKATNIAGFQSRGHVEKYLNMKIKPDGTCKSWVDPKKSLHAVFEKKQWIS